MKNKRVKRIVKTVAALAGAAGVIAGLIWAGILKWVLLGIALLLGVILLAVGLVLFIPVRYRASLASEEGMRVSGRLSWLLHLITVKIKYDGSDLKWSVRIAGIAAASSEKKEKKKNAGKKEELEIPKEESVSPAEAEERHDNKTGKKSSSNIWHRFREYWKLLRENRQALKKVYRTAVRCIKTLFPKKCDLYLRFGFADPAVTGEVYGGYWAVYPALINPKTKKLKVEADFQQKIFLISGWAKGWFNLFGLLWPLLKIMPDPDVRELYKDFKSRKY